VNVLQKRKVEDAHFRSRLAKSRLSRHLFRGMKAYNGIATLSLEKPQHVIYGLNEGPDSEDFRIIQTVIRGIPFSTPTFLKDFSLIRPVPIQINLVQAPAECFLKKGLDPATGRLLGDSTSRPAPGRSFSGAPQKTCLLS